MSDSVLIAKVLLKLTSIWGPALIPWLAALVRAESTAKIHNLAHTRFGWCNSQEENLRREGRPRATDIITAISEQVLDWQCLLRGLPQHLDLASKLRAFQQQLTELAAEVRQNEQPRQKTEAA